MLDLLEIETTHGGIENDFGSTTFSNARNANSYVYARFVCITIIQLLYFIYFFYCHQLQRLMK